ncbi:unnamed protein product [Lactuca saligna]|uniref:Uncharacterized protein n=1 Tax=Lactuca saligna TaxID=75948 RepID=A0AA35ZB95_LACSI|nr:unnamed protein product [Lactuca saligna]
MRCKWLCIENIQFDSILQLFDYLDSLRVDVKKKNAMDAIGFTSAMAVVAEATSPTKAKAEERSLEEWWPADGGRANHLVAVRRCSGGGSAVCVEREEGTGKSEGQAWIGACIF